MWWKIAKLERDSVLGPFTFRVKLDGTVSEFAGHHPGGGVVSATRAGAGGIAGARACWFRWRAAGLHRVRPAGNAGFERKQRAGGRGAHWGAGAVCAGGSGDPAGDGDVPASEREREQAAEYGTADVVVFSVFRSVPSPQVTFAKSISIALPSLWALMLGIETSVFVTNDLENWGADHWTEAGQGRGGSRAIGFGGGGGFGQFGGQCISQFGFSSCGFGGGFGSRVAGFGAFGYVEQDNSEGKTAGSVLGGSAIAALTSPPSIIAILIGAIRN